MSAYRIYGFEGCPYCQKAKRLLDEEAVPYEYIAIEALSDRALFLDARGFVAPDRTFPRVYALVQGQEVLVGGYSELEDARVEAMMGEPAPYAGLSTEQTKNLAAASQYRPPACDLATPGGCA